MRVKIPYPKTYHPRYQQLVTHRFEEILADPNAPIQPLIDTTQAKQFAAAPIQFGKPQFGHLMAGPCNSLMLSIATIPLPIGSFIGCICAVCYHGHEYHLATYRGVRVVRWSNTSAVICQGNYRLEMDILRENRRPLRAPVVGDMCRTIHESVCATVRYWF